MKWFDEGIRRDVLASLRWIWAVLFAGHLVFLFVAVVVNLVHDTFRPDGFWAWIWLLLNVGAAVTLGRAAFRVVAGPPERELNEVVRAAIGLPSDKSKKE